jgi:hypothetical protein
MSRMCDNCLEAKPANERWSHKTGMTLCRACDVYQARYGVGIHIAAGHAADPSMPAFGIGCCIGDVCVCRLGWGTLQLMCCMRQTCMGSGSADVLRVTGMTGNQDPRSSTRSGRLRSRESAPAAHSGPLPTKGTLGGCSTLRKRP